MHFLMPFTIPSIMSVPHLTADCASPMIKETAVPNPVLIVVTIFPMVVFMPVHIAVKAPETAVFIPFTTVVTIVFIVFHAVVIKVWIAVTTVVITVLIAFHTVVTTSFIALNTVVITVLYMVK